LRDKTEQILEAAIKVFVQKGFLQATTQEIAREADVAEVTLYRKFKTKQNLFEFVVTRALEDKFKLKLQKLAEAEDTEVFFRSILIDRLSMISRNETLVKLLISESIMGNLPEQMDFTKLIFTSLKDAVQIHFDRLNQRVDAEFFAKQLGSILLGYAILPIEKPFYKLDSAQQEELINKYVSGLKANL
jgi:AcrR family transcriptional regulator